MKILKLTTMLAIAALSAGAQAADSFALLTPVTIDPEAQVPDKVREECRIEFQLESLIGAVLQQQFKGSPGTTTSTKGQVVRVKVTYVYAPAGGSWSGPKSMTILADLLEDGQVQRSTKLHRTSTGGILGRGTCAILDRDMKVLAKDVAYWLRDQHYVPKGDGEPQPASGAASGAEG